MTIADKPVKKKPAQSDYLFHPLELGVCGFSNSGKTSLIEKIIESLSKKYSIGFVKNDIHRFQMDREGKDTFKAWKAGAKQVYISDIKHQGLLTQGELGLSEQKTQFLNNDLVIAEGYKNSGHEKIVIIDEESSILEEVKKGQVNNIIAFVGRENERDDLPDLDVPYFQRDQVEDIINFVESYFLKKVYKRPLFGLLLTGGKSSRMKSDKALLKYKDRSQAEEGYELLSGFCEQTFISSRQGQWKDTELDKYPQVYDKFLEMGPTGGILSAMKEHPEASWLVVACDLPFLDKDTIKYLLDKRNSFKMASCFTSNHFEGMPEPLCAIYEPKSYKKLLEFVGLGYTCPRKMLLNVPILQLDLPNKMALDNVNHPNEYTDALKVINPGANNE